jgi:hypothetical protein
MCIPFNHGFVVVSRTTRTNSARFVPSSSGRTTTTTTTTTPSLSSTTLFVAATPTAPNSTVAEPEAEAEANSSMTRDERYDKALSEAKTKKVGELKQELMARKISTKSFFEKTEFEKAYATAMADNVPVTGSSSSGSSSSSSSSSDSQQRTKTKQDEPMDPSYRDVTMQKFNRQGYGGQSVIDIRLPKD